MNISELKDIAKVKVMDVVSHYVTLKKEGKEWKGLCPFHPDSTPSLSVNPEKGIWKCFSCGAGGTGGFSFAERIEGTENNFHATVARLAEILNTDLPERKRIYMKADIEKTDPVDKPVLVTKEWTDTELQLIGSTLEEVTGEDGQPLLTEDGLPVRRARWKGEEMENLFSFYSLESFTLPPGKDSKTGKSIRRKSSDSFPIFAYIYTDDEGNEWGRIYQPLAERKNKFFNFPAGHPNHQNPVFGDRKVMGVINRLMNEKDFAVASKVAHLMICSGGTDAINVYMNTPKITKTIKEKGIDVPTPEERVHVVWLGSETRAIPSVLMQAFRKIAHVIYICFDQDETGITKMNQISLLYPYIHIVNLPDGMSAETEGRCKDVRDYFKSYNHKEYQSIKQKGKFFAQQIISSIPVRFWAEKIRTRDLQPTGKFDLLTDNTSAFLNANGIYTYNAMDKVTQFIQLKGNRVDLIPVDEVERIARKLMVDYIRSSYSHYNQTLVETILNSKMMSPKNLTSLKNIQLNFKYDTAKQDFFVFQNGIFRVTKNGIERISNNDVSFYIFEEKVIRHNLEIEKEQPFRVTYSKQYTGLCKRIAESAEGTEERENLISERDSLPDLYKYDLDIDLSEKTLSFIRFVYNTGRMYWKREKGGQELTEKERREYNLHFINKCWVIGFLLRKHKEESKARAVFALENTIISGNDSEGRSGKSLLFKYLGLMRSMLGIEMRSVRLEQKGDTLFAGVKPGYTDLVMLDDLRKEHTFDNFYGSVTGVMTVRQLHKDAILIPYKESPKIIFTSNYAPKLVGSTRGRICFVAFSDYYHDKSSSIGINAWSPRTEFGKDLVDDYTTEEMNQLYNFFMACVQLNMQFPDYIEPIMENIEKRTLIEELKPNIHEWMVDYFNPKAIDRRVDVPIWRDDMFEDFKTAYGHKEYAARVGLRTFRDKLQKFCAFNGWILNPSGLYRNPSEETHGSYRQCKDGKDGYFWYIKTEQIPKHIRDEFRDGKVKVVSTREEKKKEKEKAKANK